MQTLYDILGLGLKKEDVTKTEIRQAFLRLSKEFHPDKLQKTPEQTEEAYLESKNKYEEKFKEIKNAYETLHDDEKRKQYDQEQMSSKQTQNDFREQSVKTFADLALAHTRLIQLVSTGNVQVVAHYIQNHIRYLNLNYCDFITPLTPLAIAARNGNIAMMSCLFNYGASFNCFDLYGNTPAHYAAQLASSWQRSESATGYASLKWMKQLGFAATFNIPNNAFESVYDLLHIRLIEFVEASVIGDTSMIIAIDQLMQVANGMLNINYFSPRIPNTALSIAAFKGDIDMLSCLYNHGAAFTQCDFYGNLPAHWAAELAATSKYGFTILRFIADRGFADTFSVKNAHGEDVYTLCRAQNKLIEVLRQRDVNLLEEFLTMTQGFVNLNFHNEHLPLPLDIAKSLNDFDLENCLLKHGANPNVSQLKSTPEDHFNPPNFPSRHNLGLFAKLYKITKHLSQTYPFIFFQPGPKPTALSNTNSNRSCKLTKIYYE